MPRERALQRELAGHYCTYCEISGKRCFIEERDNPKSPRKVYDERGMSGRTETGGCNIFNKSVYPERYAPQTLILKGDEIHKH